MIYVTSKMSPKYKQYSFEDFFFGDVSTSDVVMALNLTNTKTYCTEHPNEKLLAGISVDGLITKLREFNAATERLREPDRQSLYITFYIPKRSGGLRRIDAPNEELMSALRALKSILEVDFYAAYHTSAFAYVRRRSTIDLVKRHQQNESHWYGKFDFSNFFGSHTLEYTMNMLSMIFPFSEVCRSAVGKAELTKAIELGFLNGGLPQGTPLSPMLTNILMIPIDFHLSKKMRERNIVYTRYADDIIVSSKYDFAIKEIEADIEETLTMFNAPFRMNKKKTRYGSRAGSNWNLGLMVNKDNDITVGHKRKRQFENMLAAFCASIKNDNPWPVGDVMVLEGHRSYYNMVEKSDIDALVKKVGTKYGVNIIAEIKNILR